MINMELPLEVMLVLHGVTIIFSSSILLYFWIKGNKTPLLYSYIVYQKIVLLWTIGYTLELFAPNDYYKWQFIRLQYLSVCFLAYSWLIFCFLYTGKEKYLTRRNVLVTSLLPIISLILVQTNEYHYLIFSKVELHLIEREILFWILYSVMIMGILIGTIILIVHSIKQHGNARKQTFLIILAGAIPYTIGFIKLSPFVPPGYDPTPSSFSISLALCAIATFKYRFLNIMPMAYREIVGNIKDAIIVIDNSNTIVYFNKSFASTLNEFFQLKRNENINNFINNLKKYSLENREEIQTVFHGIECAPDQHISGELNFVYQDIKTCFNVSVQPVLNNKSKLMGRIVSFNDITEYKCMLHELADNNSELTAMNEELTALNEQLNHYASTIKELTVTKERNRFARDVHDTLGRTMTLLIATLELSAADFDSDRHKSRQRIYEAVNIAKSGLKEIRRSISGLAPRNIEADNLICSIKNLICEFSLSGLNVELSVDGSVSYTNPVYSETIYRVCQEALTNSLRHGKAKHVTIILKLNYDKIKLFIFDDGYGCKNFSKGFGLTGLEQRVKEVNGSIDFGSDGEMGFNINLEIPLGV